MHLEKEGNPYEDCGHSGKAGSDLFELDKNEGFVWDGGLVSESKL